MIISIWVNVYKNPCYVLSEIPIGIELKMYDTMEEARDNAYRGCLGQLELSGNVDFIMKGLEKEEEK